MYHIRNDRRVKRSAELISEALMTCLEEHSFEEITVVDVQKEAGVGRTTFYRLFDNLTDVLSYLSDEIFHVFLSSASGFSSMSQRDRSVSFISCWMKHSRVLEAIVKSGRSDILQESHLKNLPDLFSFTAADREFCICQLTAIMTSSLEYWIRHGKKESAEELYEKVLTSGALIATVLK